MRPSPIYRIPFGLTLFLCLFAPLRLCVTSSAGDWTHWRGPQQNGYSPETGLPASWSPGGENLVWKAPYGGRTTPIIMNGRVYLINASGQGITEQERVMALDAATGKLIW